MQRLGLEAPGFAVAVAASMAFRMMEGSGSCRSGPRPDPSLAVLPSA
jgi:hypothetical protein